SSWPDRLMADPNRHVHAPIRTRFDLHALKRCARCTNRTRICTLMVRPCAAVAENGRHSPVFAPGWRPEKLARTLLLKPTKPRAFPFDDMTWRRSFYVH